MVKQVEEIKTELNRRHLPDLPIFIHGEIRIYKIWTAAKSAWLNITRDGTDRITNQRECSRIDDGVAVPACRATLSCEQWPQWICKSGLHKRVQSADPAGNQGSGIFRAALIDGEIVPIRRSSDTADLPTSKHASCHPVRTT